MKHQLLFGVVAFAGTLSVLKAADEPFSPSSLAAPADASAVQPAQPPASSSPIGFFVAPNIGTLGAGLEVGYQFNPRLKLRARSNWIAYDRDKRSNDVLYKVEAQNMNGGLMLDYHPWAGTFHFTAGLLISDLNAKADGSTYSPDGGYVTIGDDVYRANGNVVLRGKYAWNKAQPYIGVGWSTDGDGDRSWYVTADLGIAILGKGKFTSSYSGDVRDAQGNPVSPDRMHESLRREADDVLKICDRLTVYPVIQIGVGYRF